MSTLWRLTCRACFLTHIFSKLVIAPKQLAANFVTPTYGGEGRGQDADYSSSNPLAPALSPLGRGEGVGGDAKLRPDALTADSDAGAFT